MKIKIFCLISALIITVSLSVAALAEAGDFYVKTPAGMVSSYTNGDLSAVAKVLKMDESELIRQCDENDVLYIAVNSDNTVQVRISSYETEYSKRMSDITLVSDNNADKLSDDISKNGYEKTTIGGILYFKTVKWFVDSGGEYQSEQYFTVKNSRIYQISVYISSGQDSRQAEELLSSFKITEKIVYSSKQKTVISIGIAVFAGLVLIMLVSIIKDLKTPE